MNLSQGWFAQWMLVAGFEQYLQIRPKGSAVQANDLLEDADRRDKFMHKYISNR